MGHTISAACVMVRVRVRVGVRVRVRVRVAELLRHVFLVMSLRIDVARVLSIGHRISAACVLVMHGPQYFNSKCSYQTT